MVLQHAAQNFRGIENPSYITVTNILKFSATRAKIALQDYLRIISIAISGEVAAPATVPTTIIAFGMTHVADKLDAAADSLAALGEAGAFVGRGVENPVQASQP